MDMPQNFFGKLETTDLASGVIIGGLGSIGSIDLPAVNQQSFSISQTITGWLVVSTHLKICSSKWESFPNRGENKNYLKPPPSRCLLTSNSHESSCSAFWQFLFTSAKQHNIRWLTTQALRQHPEGGACVIGDPFFYPITMCTT